MARMAYLDEINSFENHFKSYRNSRIVLYGIGRFTATITSALMDKFNFVGLLDKDLENIGKIFYGLPILSLEEAERNADLIIINTSETYWKLIFRRIENCKLPVFYRNGEQACKEFVKYNAENTYWNLSIEDIYDLAKNYDIVSFDVFDTLMQRSCLFPSDVFCFLEKHAIKRFSFNFSFSKERAEAGQGSTEKFLSLDEIYINLQKKLRLSDEQREWLKAKEIEIELGLCEARKPIVDLCNNLAKEKKIYLVSDMYLPASVIRRMLDKCNVSKDVELWVSVEKKASKKVGNIWKVLKNSNPGKKIFHVGDNEKSDVLIPRKNGIDSFHILSAAKILENSSAGGVISRIASCSESLFVGLLCKKLFSNPFSMKNSNGKIVLRTFEDLGYVLFGGLFLSFFFWSLKKTKELNIKRLLFFARDGYWFVENFNFFKELLVNIGDTEHRLPECQYLPISRSLVLVSAIDTENGWNSLLSFPYVGEFSDFVAIRLHYELPKSDLHFHSVIGMPAQKQEIEEWLIPYKKDILKLLKKEKLSYMKCLSKFNVSENDACVDLWFHGNNQFYLSKTVGKHLTGFYFAANLKTDNNCAENNILIPCFQQPSDPSATKCNIKKQSQFVESFLTAPYGTILSVQDDGSFVCAPKMKTQKFWKERIKMNDGVKEFIKDFVSFENKELSPMFINDFWGEIVNENIVLSDELKSVFFYDNILIKKQEYPVFE